MSYIVLSDKASSNIKIMVFVEGTILKPKSFFSLYNHKSYIPIGDAVSLISKWEEQGAEIVYCTSRKKRQAEEMAELLLKYKFVGTRLYFRNSQENYKNLIETIKPDILIEDDCKSIGGSWQMCITHVEPEIKKTIKSVVAKEFKGIDHLSSSLQDILNGN